VEPVHQRSPGVRAFSVVWFGQLVSMLGTGMTRLALSVWAWQETGSATAPADYYTAQAGKLLRWFDRAARHYRPVLAARLADESPDEIVRETRREFERLLPAIPYIGGRKNSLTRILIGCTMSLALYRILKGRGVSVKEIGHIVVEIEESREGGGRCDFRWKKGQETRPAWPPAWLERDDS
jgi:hypothetical protein